MKVFITGATGYIGHPVAKAFRHQGYEVWGLARSREKCHHLAKHEIRPILGNMANPEDWIYQIPEADIFIHAGFDTSGEGIEVERRTLDALLEKVLPETLFVYTSGCWVYGNTNTPAKESDALNPIPIVTWRPPHEQKVLQASCKSIVLRPGLVYGKSAGLTSLWFKSAHAEKVIQIGNGQNHLSLVHVDDLAEAFVLAVLKGKDKQIYNVGDNSSYTVGQITEALKNLTGSFTINQMSLERGTEEFGALAQGYCVDQLISSEKVKNELGWQPVHPKLLDDLKTYYEAWRTTPLT